MVEVLGGSYLCVLAVCSWCLALASLILLVKSSMHSAASPLQFGVVLVRWSKLLVLVLQDMQSDKMQSLRGFGPRLQTFFV